MAEPARKAQLDAEGRGQHDDGMKFLTYDLIGHIYYGRTKDAQATIVADPDQVAMPEAVTLLTPLHVAIFREDDEVIAQLLQHPKVDLHAQDKFGRTPLDMLHYSHDEDIHLLVLEAYYPDTVRRIIDDEYDEARAAGRIKPFAPPKP
jgi:hypothetical protein